MTTNILSFDGGGMKGIFSLRLLLRLLKKYPSLVKKCSLFAGTSTGSIIAVLLAYEMPPDEIFDFYKKCTGKVFEDSYLDDIKDLGKLLGADYDYNNLKKLLKQILGNTKLKDLKHKVLVPTFDLDNESKEARTWKPKVFNNFQSQDGDEFLVDIIIRSAAAPTFFPAYQGFVDGGLAINSPALAAACQALDSGCNLKDIKLISIGTGTSPTFISGKKLDWGLAKWGPFLIDMIFDSMEMVTHYQCKKLLKDNYLRVNTFLKEKVSLDDDTKVNTMINYADEIDLNFAYNWIANHWT